MNRATLVLVLLSFAPRAVAQGPAVHLRPVDRATVRIISLRGLDAAAVEGRRTRVRRVVARALTSHGSGVAVGPDLVLTARHVVWGADAWIVVPPGSSEPMTAVPVYVDTDHDVAFVRVDGRLRDRVPLPDQERPLTLSENVSVSGYPLDLREYTPAAASGEVSRVTRTGELHLTLTVNPGHSGGPVIDSEGRLVGILSARGRLEQGVEGLVIAVPLGPIRAARQHVPAEPPTFVAEQRDLSRGLGYVAGVGADSLLDHRDDIQRLLQHAAQWTSVDADRDATLAGLAWNTAIEHLEAHDAADIEHLPEAERGVARLLLQTATLLARRALRTGPQVRREFPVLRAISNGRVQAVEPGRRRVR